ncbi:cyclic nucleotide-binding domain-containing protein, partial [Roseiarcus sp.]|uniref:cyclic nucleotide-binding domain-containing protein n=1 Tax=Roseiarcus sp. TaxID=1969460 RepID=UPI003D0AD867
AGKLKQASYDKGEALVKPEDVLQSLFIVGSGVLEATRRNDDGENDQLRFGPGDYFGEMGLLAGTPASATIAALSPSIVYELTKSDLRPVLEARPEIAQELSRALAQRFAAGRGLARTAVDTSVAAKGLSAWISVQMHRLFELSSAK